MKTKTKPDRTIPGPPRKTFLDVDPKTIATSRGVVITASRPERAKALAISKHLAKPVHTPNPTSRPPPSPIHQYPLQRTKTKSSRGRRTIQESMSPTEILQEIREFLSDLAASSDPDEKKRIRRALRLRGHRGGLSSPAEPLPQQQNLKQRKQ